nr:hypothetical protein [Tanacetum cinerariifolium]
MKMEILLEPTSNKLMVGLLKEATKRSKKDFHISQASGSSDGTNFESGVHDEQQRKTSGADKRTGTKPGVPRVPKYLSESENESWGDSGDVESNDDDSDDVTKNDDKDGVESDANEDNEGSDNEKTDSDEDENLNVNLNDDEEEEHKEEYVRTPNNFEFNDDNEEYDELYKDVNIKSKVVEHEEVGKGDAEMTDTAHESSKQSSSVSSDFASKFLNLDNIPPFVDEVASLMNVKTPHEELSTQAPSILSVPVMAILEASNIHATTIPLLIQPFSYIPQMITPTPVPTTEPTNSSIPALPDFASYSDSTKEYLYDASVKSYQLDKDLFDFYGKVYSLKRGRKDKDKDEDPPAGSDQGLKKRKMRKDAESTKGSKSKESKSSSSKGSKSQSKSSEKSARAEEPMFETTDTEMPQDQEDDMGNTEDQPNVEEASKHDWWKFKQEIYNFYYKNQAAKYDTIEGIEDMVLSLWSPVKDVFYTKRIIAVTPIKVVKNYEYGKSYPIWKEVTFFYLNVALRMFTILKRVEDLQLGVESYQKNLNITRPETFRSDVTKMTPYTAYNNPQGIIYQDKFQRNSLEMDYLPKRRWSKLDRKRSRIMIKAIDQQLFEKRLMRNLEKFVRGREYRTGFRILEWTI